MSETIQSVNPPEEPLYPGAPVAGQEVGPQDDQVDYFIFAGSDKFVFPDGRTFIEYQKMNEGQKARYEARTQGDFELDRRSGNARVRVDPGKQRAELIRSSAIGWNFKSGGQPVPFSVPNLDKWLTVADPEIVQHLAEAIEKINPWMKQNVTAADIRAEIANLEQQLKEAEAREAGEDSSSSR